MSDSRAAAAIDRLPWLDDEPHTPPGLGPKSVWSVLWRWAPPALVLVAGISFWLGTRAAPSDEFDAPAPEAPAAATLPLPEPLAPVIDPDAVPAPVLEPVLAKPTIALPAPPPAVRQGRAQPRRAVSPTPKAGSARRKLPPASSKLRYWPARASTGAAGRMVRIGTFGTSAGAKKGWHGVVRIYPGMNAIPALVVPQRSLRDGRTYYRLQMGTTSQAHSEVLCQRMRIIGQSCVVVGLSHFRAATP